MLQVLPPLLSPPLNHAKKVMDMQHEAKMLTYTTDAKGFKYVLIRSGF